MSCVRQPNGGTRLAFFGAGGFILLQACVLHKLSDVLMRSYSRKTKDTCHNNFRDQPLWWQKSATKILGTCHLETPLSPEAQCVGDIRMLYCVRLRIPTLLALFSTFTSDWIIAPWCYPWVDADAFHQKMINTSQFYSWNFKPTFSCS